MSHCFSSYLQGKLTAHDSVASHTLAGLQPASAAPSSSKKSSAPSSAPPPIPDDLPVLLLVDTAGCGFEERQEEEGDSRSNEGEAKVSSHIFM